MQPPMDDAPIAGLSAAEAATRAESGLQNRMPPSREGGVGAILRRNLLTLFNLLNVALAVLLICVGSYRNLLFMGVIVSNALIGTVQELRAKRTHDKLVLLSQGKVRTLRDGAQVLLPPDELVQGDVVLLRRGDQAPADARVLRGFAAVSEAMLTGESEPVEKAAGSELLSGSYLTEGAITAELTRVGAQSYAGQLQTSARKLKRAHSRLMDSLSRLIRIVSIALVPVGGLLFIKQYFVLHAPLESSVAGSVAAMLGMIPEGLILLTSVALAVGVIKLGRKKTLVNELYGIETLARADVLCLDKTGTITQGSMSLEKVLPVADADEAGIRRLLGALLNAFSQEQSGTWDALSAAIPPLADAPAATYAVPFSSARKWCAAQFDALGAVALGAPERLLSEGDPLRKKADALCAEGYRVLALGQGGELAGERLPDDLRVKALLLLFDPVRHEAAETLAYFAREGVEIKVISGDNALTVSRAAQMAALVNAEKAIDLSAIEGDVDYDALSREYTVFGRVSPEDKRQLVLALKRQGRSVAMIGDGVNDIPALKTADCSIAVAGGSDAAQRVAQLTLLSSDFSALPDVVLEGRRVINNITRAASMFMTKNVFSALLSLLLLALPFSYPFAPIQLTLVSTLFIGIPTFFLALEPSREKVRGHFLRTVLLRALPAGVCVALHCVVLMLLKERLGLTSEGLSTLCTLLAGGTLLWALVATCLPMTKLRLALCAVMAAAFVLASLLLPGVFYFVMPTLPQALVALGLFLLTPLLLWLGRRLSRRLDRAERGADKKEVTA